MSRRARLGAVASGTLALVVVLAIGGPMILRHGAPRGSSAMPVTSAPSNPDAPVGIGQTTLDAALRAQSESVTLQARPLDGAAPRALQ